ncbi:MAG: shikimate dehydrogenase, partial [Caldilinea sp.]|nr:shikimate dehydrogenase [Caldilinea sp.]
MPVPPPPQQPTFYFVGVSTGQSSSRRVFPRWMAVLGRPEVVLQGVDFPLHDDPANYRAFVAFVRREPLALGGLVTTHKVDLLHAAADLFDELSSAAAALQEVSSIARRGDRLLGHATDSSAGGISLDAVTGPGYFGATGAHVLCLGAGGAAAAIALHLLSKPDPADRPARFVVVNRSPGRLESLRAIVAPFGDASRFDYILNEDPRRNDELMAALPDHSIVI